MTCITCRSAMERIAHFRILGEIGAGGMGMVYRAVDERLQRNVAIKVLSPGRFDDDTARARLLREARSAAGLNHPNICVVHEVGECDGQAYIAMEYVEGEVLDARIRRAPLSPAEVIRFGFQLADALAHAHSRGIVHRDLKPQNIIVTPEQRLKILDFGLARTLPSPAAPGASTDVLQTADNVITGTPAYLAPETLRGKSADARSDIWAAGVVLYEMGCRSRPFEGNSWPELAASILTFAPKPLPVEVPAELESVIRRCLEKEPANRYATAAELRSALEVLQSTGGTSHPLARPATRRRSWLAAAGVVAIAVSISAGLRLQERSWPWSAAPQGSHPPAVENTSTIASVAVLPFSTFSGQGQEYLSDGIQDAVIGELARVKPLRVISRTSARACSTPTSDVAEIGRRLRADNVVEGSVSRSGDRIVVRVSLIRVRPEERQLWSESFERDMGDVLTLYSEIGSRVATQIDATLAPQRSDPARRINPAIYTLYLRAMHHLHRGGPAGFDAGIALLNEAIALDPADPLPYAGLAHAYELRIHDGLATPEDIALAKAAAKKASNTSVGLPEVYAAKAMIAQYSEWDWTAAKENFERALDLNSSLAEVRRHYAWYLLAHRRGEEALAQMRRGSDIEPLDPTFYADLAWMLTSVGRPAEAVPEARKAVQLAAGNPYVLENAGFALAQNRLFDEALGALRKAEPLDVNARWLSAQALVASGHTREAQALIEEFRKSGTADAAYALVQLYAALGNRDEAVRWAEVAREKHAIYAPWMGVDAGLVSIRNDPRFRKTMASMRVPM